MKQAGRNDLDELRPEYTKNDFVGGVRAKYAGRMPRHRLTLSLECSEQADGRWLARIANLPGVAAYGDSPESAVVSVEALAAAALAARVQRGEIPPTGLCFAITTIYATPRHTPN
jgi:predicted RNase H-like HicB family nuclease